MKNKTSRSKEYLTWIASQACIITGSHSHDSLSVVAHHVRLRSQAGTGQKPSDYRTIPLRQDYHQFLHQIGEKEFYRRNEINVEKYILHYLTTWAIILDREQEAIKCLEKVVHG